MSNQKRSNILWHCYGQKRWDTTASLGNTFISNTNLDALTNQDFAFENAYTQSPICNPARAGFLT